MSANTWRLMVEGPGDGRVHMAVDWAVLRACAAGQAPPTLRLYGWRTPTLTLGYFQKIGKEIDSERCRKLNIPIVRRPTGGRALLHHAELTYSVIAPIPHPMFPSNLGGTIQVIAETLVRSLGKLGVREAVIAQAERNRSVRTRSPSCLAAVNHSEIAVGSRKLVGSAQRRLKQAFLQHGSILLDFDAELTHSLFRFESSEKEGRALDHLRRSVTTLAGLTGREIRFDDAGGVFREGFQESFPGEWRQGELNSFEESLRDEVMKSNPREVFR